MVRWAKNNSFQIFVLFAIEMAIFSVFYQKKGLALLAVKEKNCSQLEPFKVLFFYMDKLVS